MVSLLTLLNRFENAAGVYERSDKKADRDELHAARRAIMEAFEELRIYAHEATKAITGLTSGGSEYFGKKIGDMYTADLPFCVERIRASQTRTHERLQKAVGEKKAERRKIFDSLMGIYAGWVRNPGKDDSGAIALSIALVLIFPEFRDEARERAEIERAALRSSQQNT